MKLVSLLLQFLFHLILLLSFSFHGNAKPHVKSIFSFGDSYADTGNLPVLAAKHLIPIPALSINPPYGITFFHRPNGRFCDGRLILDFIAQELGLPFVPPYLAQNGSFKQGANFAVSGSTGLDFFVKINATIVDLDVELQWFEDLKPSLCNTAKKCRKFFGKSLFFVGEFGVNDYTIALVLGKSLSEVRSYVPSLVQTISKAIERLIVEGAQTIVVAGIPPYGCIPVILTVHQSANKTDYEAQTGCLKKFDEISRYQNSLLHKSVTDLRCKFPNVNIIFADYSGPIIELLKSPKHLGFIETPLRVCCGVGGQYNYNISKICGMPGVKACKNPSQYLNWDGVHFTEGANRYTANGWLNGPYADPPILNTCGSKKKE